MKDLAPPDDVKICHQNTCQTDRQTENYRGPQIAVPMELRGYAGQYNNSKKDSKDHFKYGGAVGGIQCYQEQFLPELG